MKLNEDMISYSGDIVKLDKNPEHYQEGPWVYKRNGHYYMAFAATCCPEGLGYAMSDKPTGPWTTKGYIMKPTQRTRGNHPGIIDYKGSSYVFGLSYDLMHLETFKHHERRSSMAAKMHYNADGTIQEVPYWTENILEQIELFNPYRRVEAETMAWGYGLKTEKMPDGRICLTGIDHNESLCVRGVDFGKGAKEFSVLAACNVDGGHIDIRLDSTSGPLIGTLEVTRSGAMDRFKLMSCAVNGAKGCMIFISVLEVLLRKTTCSSLIIGYLNKNKIRKTYERKNILNNVGNIYANIITITESDHTNDVHCRSGSNGV